MAHSMNSGFPEIHKEALTRRQSMAPEKASFSLQELRSLICGYVIQNLPFASKASMSFFIHSCARRGNSKAPSFNPFYFLTIVNLTLRPFYLLILSRCLRNHLTLWLKLMFLFNCRCLSSTPVPAGWESAFHSFSQVICFFLFFSFFFSFSFLMQSRATDYKEAVWLQQ